MIERCAGQVRVGPKGPYGLDFTAVLMMADAMGGLSTLLVDALPSIEPIILSAYRSEDGDAD